MNGRRTTWARSCAPGAVDTLPASPRQRRHRIFPLATTLFCLAAAPLSATNSPSATVSFLDGSFLRGELESLSNGTLRWRHPSARQVIEFSTTSLDLIRLQHRPSTASTNLGPSCRVQLAGGDEFEGRLIAVDTNSFEVETWFAGRLRGQRSGLASLTFYGTTQSAYYDGPRAAEEWRSSLVSPGRETGARGVNFGNGLFPVPVPPRPAPGPPGKVSPPEAAKPAPEEAAKKLKAAAELKARVKAEAEVNKARVEAQAAALAEARAKALNALRVKVFNQAPGNEPVLQGPAATEAQAATHPAWNFREGAFYSAGVGTLGRECQLPSLARIEFDLAWKGQPYFRFSFFTRSVDHFDFGDGWQFYSSSSGFLYPMRRAGLGAAGSGGVRVPQMLAKNSVRFTFLVNTEKASVILLADGEKLQEWRNLGHPGDGTGMIFYNYNPNSQIRVGEIHITPWNGKFQSSPATSTEPAATGTPPVETPAENTALVEFVNQDRATGALHGIRDGKLLLNAAGAQLEVPLARASQIIFARPAPPAKAPAAPEVQVTLHRNERLTLTLEKWTGQEITVNSAVLGRLKLKPEAIRTLRFNPAAARNTADEWGRP